MDRPRILIVDTDINYIIPLQQKFVKEYFEKIDLEIISDQNYYEQFFVSPQKADILIVSEELYTPAINRHNIRNVFVMAEQYTEIQCDNSGVNRIYKYTNIRDIFNTIAGKSAISSESLNNIVKKETNIILVYAGCGGVGKTTIAFGVSACLSKNYKKALYLNAARLHTFQTLLENMSPITSTDVYVELTKPHNDMYAEIKHILRNEGFDYIPPFRIPLMSLGVKYSIYERIAVSAKKSGEYDYIIIDTDSAFDEDKARLIDIADKVIIVTKQSKACVYATNVLADNINGSNSDKYIFVCNDFDEDIQNYLISPDILKKFNVAEYVEHFCHYDQLKASDLANKNDMEKIAYLVS